MTDFMSVDLSVALNIHLCHAGCHARAPSTRGVTALTKAVSGEKQIYSGNLEFLPGIGKPGKFFGKNEIFSGH